MRTLAFGRLLLTEHPLTPTLFGEVVGRHHHRGLVRTVGSEALHAAGGVLRDRDAAIAGDRQLRGRMKLAGVRALFTERQHALDRRRRRGRRCRPGREEEGSHGPETEQTPPCNTSVLRGSAATLQNTPSSRAKAR